MKPFGDLGLAEAILRALTAEGYAHPTPIQSRLIPAMLAGRDIVGVAQTGTGKTAAFVLPVLTRIALQRPRLQARSCHTLVLAPTRELAAQIAAAVRTYGRFVRVTTALVVGGARPGPQIKAMARGVDIIVATPGRLLDHLSAGVIRLDHATTVVLDEADQMMDLGFMPAIRQLMARLPENRQTVLLSATMPGPIRRLAEDFLDDPEAIEVAPGGRPIERIDQKIMQVEGSAKNRVLIDLLAQADVARTIVFTRTKHRAERVNLHLQQAGVLADALHGDKSQGQRQRALAAFRTGKVNVLVATDIAARGIDVDDVSHVVNYDLPHVPEAYVHRIGRTARAGKSGVAVSLCDPAERGLLRAIERLIGKPFPGIEAASPARCVLKDAQARPHRRSAKPGGGGRAAVTRSAKKRRQEKRPGGPRPSSAKGQPTA